MRSNASDPASGLSSPASPRTSGYHTDLVLDPRLQREIKALRAYLKELEALVQQGRPDVVICDIPEILQDLGALGPGGDPEEPEASIAWNFFTALYYKAGGTPWRMVRTAPNSTVAFRLVFVLLDKWPTSLSTSVSIHTSSRLMLTICRHGVGENRVWVRRQPAAWRPVSGWRSRSISMSHLIRSGPASTCPLPVDEPRTWRQAGCLVRPISAWLDE